MARAILPANRAPGVLSVRSPRLNGGWNSGGRPRAGRHHRRHPAPLPCPRMPPVAVPASLAWRTERLLFCGFTSSGTLIRAPISDMIVSRLIKQPGVVAGIDPRRHFGHSPRRGLLTTAFDPQLPLRLINLTVQSRHRSIAISPQPRRGRRGLGQHHHPGRLWRGEASRIGAHRPPATE